MTGISNVLGFFWCGRGYCIPSCQPKKYNVFFFIPTVTFESSYAYDTHSDMNLVPSTTDLTRAPYNLFGSHYSVTFILNPLPAR